MGWRNPPPTWPTMPPLAGEPEDGAGSSAWTGCPARGPLQIAKRGEGRREPSRPAGSCPQPHVSSDTPSGDESAGYVPAGSLPDLTQDPEGRPQRRPSSVRGAVSSAERT